MREQEFIHWEPEHSIGIAIIDSQHKELVNFVNSLISLSNVSLADRKKYTQKILSAAENHMENHFDTEMEILSKTRYEKLADHKKEHDKLLGKIAEIQHELEREEENIDFYYVAITLKEYFLSHILLYDKEAIDFFKEGINSF